MSLSREDYEALHDGRPASLTGTDDNHFVIARVGERLEGAFQDRGVEYYRFGAASAPAPAMLGSP